MLIKCNARVLSIASGFLAVFACSGLACKSRWSKVINEPIQVTVQADQSKRARVGDLCVTLKNRSTDDLVFQSDHLPWEFNAGGIDFVIHREDGSLVNKTPMIADAIVGMPALLKRGRELSQGMSLLVYYVDLPKELALHDLKVNWSYVPKPTDSIVSKALTGEFLLKRLTPSGEDHGP